MNFKTADLYDTHADKVQVVQPGMMSFGLVTRFRGEMVTISADGDFSRVREQVNLPGHGKVLVIDNKASMSMAMLGDRLAAAAIGNGWQGIVINGCIRDCADIAGMDLGVKALATTPRPALRDGRGELNVELEFLGAVFRAGEYLYSDEDGILLCRKALI